MTKRIHIKGIKNSGMLFIMCRNSVWNYGELRIAVQRSIPGINIVDLPVERFLAIELDSYET